MLGQSSFRRILLLRILLLSIPILFLGTAVTFRKARTSLLSTARQNLEQSAIRKAETIKSTIQGIGNTLAIAGETTVLQSAEPKQAGTYLDNLQTQLPAVTCLQMREIQTRKVVASTCQNQTLEPVSLDPAAADKKPLRYAIKAEPEQPPIQTAPGSRLTLFVTAAVPGQDRQPRYTLTGKVVLEQPEQDIPRLLEGATIIIQEDGLVLSHILRDQVGNNITQDVNQDRLQDILKAVERGETDNRQLQGLTDPETEWIAGFTPLRIELSDGTKHTWAILAITKVESALQGLQDIAQSLLLLTVGLLAAHLLAMVYMARDLALPIEQLGKYALRIHRRNSLERAPKNFRIRELNHLAEVLDNMVGRLEERARELESAWQEAEAANQLKSEFLANTSHELRTPLNAIIGCIRLVKDGCCDSQEEEIEFLEQADKAAIHLLKIINDLLDIQRIEQEKLPLAMEVINLQQILKDVVALEVVQIQQKGLDLLLKELPAATFVRADPARLKQVLLNVIYNAIKFTDRGGITIETRIDPAFELRKEGVEINGHFSDSNGHSSRPWAIVTVEDTGIGIDPAQQHKLFRPFVMVDGTTTRKFEGTGLGLAISRSLIEKMGGRISLHSDGMDKGTTVEIALPLVEVSASDLASTPNLEETVAKSSVEPTAIG
jgi:signal transduction histidine kinase